MKERDYEDRLDKMGAKLNFKLDLEERLIEDRGTKGPSERGQSKG